MRQGLKARTVIRQIANSLSVFFAFHLHVLLFFILQLSSKVRVRARDAYNTIGRPPVDTADQRLPCQSASDVSGRGAGRESE